MPIDSVYRSFHVTIGRSAVHTQLWLLQRLLGLFVTRCALWKARHNSLQTTCLQWVMTRYHTRHIAGDRSTQVGHEMRRDIPKHFNGRISVKLGTNMHHIGGHCCKGFQRERSVSNCVQTWSSILRHMWHYRCKVNEMETD